ncbi:DUF4199 domain-containing protein [Algoriphagus marincola]|uniref:DUF4199 domain-containing protein n=1 Tax=Algoriphagus marincola TaxID=264027 RepID=A0ABS7N6X6_9BACT|nr:DUF4199 domain-containing protein [Algoriphagus marincola]MBY5952099.1 DUF4199 domain-containing protein [Algoriphagus marincola]
MKKLSIEIKWALIFVAMMLIWMVFEKSMGWHDEKIADHATYTNLVAIPSILIYVFALRDKKKNFYGGYLSFKQGFVSGMIITLIVAMLTPLSQYITSTYITPDYFSNVIEYSVSTGIMERSAAKEFFNLKSYIIQATIGAFIMGLITSLVVAFLVKSKKGTPMPSAS